MFKKPEGFINEFAKYTSCNFESPAAVSKICNFLRILQVYFGLSADGT